VPFRRGRLAQLGERQLDMLEVGGSKPSPPTKDPDGVAAGTCLSVSGTIGGAWPVRLVD
jgi:hypothetical protein